MSPVACRSKISPVAAHEVHIEAVEDPQEKIVATPKVHVQKPEALNDKIVDPKKVAQQNAEFLDIDNPEKNEQMVELTSLETLKAILPAAAGAFVEWYDFAIYSFTSPYITDNFFSELGGSLGTWAGFGVTFLFRPLGGVFFGFLGDTIGRKRALQLTVTLMVTTSFLQGVLPSFVWPGKAWGWVGAVLLLVIRALQGLSAGGELATAAVYISEVAPKHALGLNLSWLSTFGCFGAWVIASLVLVAIEKAVGPQGMIEYGWRIPYFIGLVPGIITIYFRQYLAESSDFEERINSLAEAKREASGTAASKKGPLGELFQDHKLALLISTLGSAGLGAFWYVPIFYGPRFLKALHPNVPETAMTLSEGIAFLVPALCAPLIGMLVDKLGAGKVYVFTVLVCSIVLPWPLFHWWGHLEHENATKPLIVGELIVGACSACSTSVYAWIVEFYPVEVRVSGVSVAYNIGVGVFGGFGPLVSEALLRDLPAEGFLCAPAAVSLACGMVSILALVCGYALSMRGKLQLNHIRDSPY